MAELSRRSEVAVATIKFYLREGLLPAGESTATNQAEYSEDHLRRLRLVRALIAHGKLSVASTRDVLVAVAEPLDRYQTLGVTHYALQAPAGKSAPPEGEPDEAAVETDRLIDGMGWHVRPESPLRETLAEGLRSLRSLHEIGTTYGAEELTPYAKLAAATARLDLDQLTGLEDRIDIAERALVLTVLLEPVLATLRRMAQEHEATLRYAEGLDEVDGNT